MTMPVHTTTTGLLTRALAVCALSALALTACSGDGDGEGGAGEPLDLEGKTFTATEVSGWVPVTGTTIELTFEDGRVAAQAGCNTLTGGATWNLDNRSSLTLALMYAFGNDVTGPSLFNNFVPGLAATEKIEMYQYSIGLQYAQKF